MPQSLEGSGQPLDNTPDTGIDPDTGLDLKDVVTQTRAELDSYKSHNQRLAAQLQDVQGKASEADKTLAGLRQLFTNEKPSAPDPDTEALKAIDAQMDEYLEAAIQAERNGTPIPLTVNNAISNLQHQKKTILENQKLRGELAEIKGEVKRLSNPELGLDNQTYSHFDNQVQIALEHIYGQDPETVERMFEPISKAIAAEVRDLQQNDPTVWRQIRKDPAKQRNLVNHFVQKHIPPRAREIMEEDRIRRTPMGTDELYAAFLEARDSTDPNIRKMVPQLRQQLLASKFYGQDFKSRRNRGSTNLF